MRSNNLNQNSQPNFFTDIVMAYEKLKDANLERKAKEQEQYKKQLEALRNKIVHDIQCGQIVLGEIKVDVRNFSKSAVEQVIGELNDQAILAKTQEEIDDDGPILYVDIVNILINAKSIDDFIERQKNQLSTNQNIFFNSQASGTKQNIEPILQMRNNR